MKGMNTKLFVGSLPWATSSDDLQNIFSQVGTVVSAQVISDKFSGRSKGFGFVDMASAEDAQKAIDQLNGQELEGRPMIVSEARPEGERSSSRDYRGGGGGGDRHGGGGRSGGFGGGRSSGFGGGRSGSRY